MTQDMIHFNRCLQKASTLGRGLVFVAAFLLGAAIANAGIGGSATPTIAGTVAVGSVNNPGAISLMMSFTGGNTADVASVTEIDYVPSADTSSGSPAESGDITLQTGTSAASSPCGPTFTVATGITGHYTFTPNSGLYMTNGQTCVVNFMFNVNSLPSVDANPVTPGIQTYAVATMDLSDTNASAEGLTGTGSGSAITTVISPCLTVTKLVACTPLVVPVGVSVTPEAALVAGSCAGATDFKSSVTGVAGSQNPAFCYSITVTNCGEVGLTITSVNDTTLGNLTSFFSATLATNQGQTIIVGPVADAATNINTVTVDTTNTTYEISLVRSSEATADVVQASVSCSKRITSVDGVLTNLGVVTILNTTNHTLVYTIGVTAGSVDLTNVVVNDVLLTNVCDSLPAGPFALAAGQLTNFTCTVSVNCSNIPSESVTNTVTVTAEASPENAQGYCVAGTNGAPVTVSSECSAVVSCTPPPTTCITRTPGFWFPRTSSTNPNCVTLLAAILANGSTLNLGFMTLPTTPTGNPFVDGTNALDQAESFFWKNRHFTGDGMKASLLCIARKELAVQLIPAIANQALFGTSPGSCKESSSVLFPADLIQQAQNAAACTNISQINSFTALLSQFNESGSTAAIPSNLELWCGTYSSVASKIAVDPTTQATCNINKCP